MAAATAFTAAAGDDDTFYKEIDAPQYVDFAALDPWCPGDDSSWFCTRMGCDRAHDSVHPDALQQSFTLQVLAARSKIPKPSKALNRQGPSLIPKCPNSAPPKPSRDRISCMNSSTSTSEKSSYRRLEWACSRLTQKLQERTSKTTLSGREGPSLIPKCPNLTSAKSARNGISKFRSIHSGSRSTLKLQAGTSKTALSGREGPSLIPKCPNLASEKSARNGIGKMSSIHSVAEESSNKKMECRISTLRSAPKLQKDVLREKSETGKMPLQNSEQGIRNDCTTLLTIDDKVEDASSRSTFLMNGKDLSTLEKYLVEIVPGVVCQSGQDKENAWWSHTSTDHSMDNLFADVNDVMGFVPISHSIDDCEGFGDQVVIDNIFDNINGGIDINDNKENAPLEGTNIPHKEVKGTTKTVGRHIQCNFKKLKPTNPKPFRLLTEERGILKVANFERRLKLEMKNEMSQHEKPRLLNNRNVPNVSHTHKATDNTNQNRTRCSEKKTKFAVEPSCSMTATKIPDSSNPEKEGRILSKFSRIPNPTIKVIQTASQGQLPKRRLQALKEPIAKPTTSISAKSSRINKTTTIISKEPNFHKLLSIPKTRTKRTI